MHNVSGVLSLYSDFLAQSQQFHCLRFDVYAVQHSDFDEKCHGESNSCVKTLVAP